MTLPEPSVCPRCGVGGEVVEEITGEIDTCLACCCPCGEYTGGGFCPDCEQADWLDCELSYGRGRDR